MKPAPMPQSIKVGPHVYSVIRKPASAMPADNGHCDCNTLQIWVVQRLKRSKAKEILLHECLHACTHPSLIQGGKLEDEEFVTAVAPVLLQVLQDNPELLEYLTQ